MMINYCFDCLLQLKVWKAVGQVSPEQTLMSTTTGEAVEILAD